MFWKIFSKTKINEALDDIQDISPTKTPPDVTYQCEKLGIELSKARIELDLELEEVSKITRIQLSHLIAIEEGRFKDLPGNTYSIGFLRTYADFLDLDSTTLIKRYKDITSGIQPNIANLDFPEPVKEGRSPGPWLILGMLILAAVAYGIWYYISHDSSEGDMVADLSSHLVESSDVPAEEAYEEIIDEVNQAIKKSNNNSAVNNIDTSKESTDAQNEIDNLVVNKLEESLIENASDSEIIIENSGTSEPQLDAGNPDVLWSSNEQISEEINPNISDDVTNILSTDNESFDSQTAQLTSSNDSSGTSEPQVYGQTNKNVRIIITATDDSWLQVQGPSNELLITRILRKGDIYRVPDRKNLLMSTGNAGVLEISVDNLVVKPLGPIGAVRRDVLLNPESLKAGTAYSQEVE